MEQVNFSPAGILLKQHELYALDDNLLVEQAMNLKSDIIAWSQQHFILTDRQNNWLYQQDASFKVDFASTVYYGLIGRYDINIKFGGPEEWKSKRIQAKDLYPYKIIEIFVDRIS